MSTSPTEEKVERLLYSLTALADIGEAITSGGTFETTARELLHLILGTLTVSKGAILLYQPETESLRVAVARGVETIQLRMKLPESVAQALVSHAQPFVLDPTEGPFAPFVSENKAKFDGMHAHIWAPLIVANRLIGVLSLSEKFGKHPYSADDLQLLSTIAHHTSIAIYNFQIIDEIRAANFKLNRKVLEMESLYDVGLAISSLLDVKELSREILQRAVMLLDASQGALFFVEGAGLKVAASVGMDDRYPEDKVVTFADVPSQLRDIVIESKTCCSINARSLNNTDDAQNMLLVPVLIGQRVAGVLMVCDKETREGFAEFTPEDEQFLAAISTQAAIAIDNVRLHSEALEKERIEKELEVAAAIQQRLLPDSSPELEGIELIGVNMSCRQVGGDYYDYIHFNNQKLGIVIADVSGKGTPAALLVSTLQASFHALLENYDIAETVTRLNKVIFKASPSYNYITFFYGILDLESRSFFSINAGHNDPLLLKASTGEWKRFATGGFCLGMFDFGKYDVEETHLEPGDILFLYTDGVTESTNLAEEEFGEDRAKEILEQHRHEPLCEVSVKLSDAIREFVGEAPQHDDLTYVLMRVH
ncbi:MAG: SpoIIE family protein phosphatase [Blastocatellia bacterium]|nr:SpoIIE family protein phosphatase [Blastocatellia bacterium]